MKRASIFFLLIALQPLMGDEIKTLQILIDATKLQLENQEKILVHLKEFELAKRAFMASQDDPGLGKKMVRKAMILHEAVEQAHLSYLFSVELMEEIAFFNDMGQAHKIKKNK
jgi:hypothetical protein